MKLLSFAVELLVLLVNPQVDGVLSRDSSPSQFGFLSIKRNITGIIQDISGFLPEMLALLAERLNFSYSYLQDVVQHTDDSFKGRGLISFLLSGEADLILVGGPITYARLKIVDYTVPFLIIQYSLLIPSPTVEMKVVAIAKPYQYPVWILIFVAITAVILSLYCISSYCANTFHFKTPMQAHQQNVKYLKSALDYTMAVFCSQGAYYRYSFKIGFKIRILAGCWCLACFVLVTAYNSVFISYVLAPRSVPIVKSILDLPKQPGIRMTTEKGGTMESLFMLAKDGLYKYIGDMIRENPYLSCNITDQCVKYVRSGKKYVYSSPITDLYAIINKDLVESHECRLSIAKTPISYPKFSLMLAKNSAFTESINEQIQLFWENGLLQHWQSSYFPKKPDRCLEEQKVAQNPRISLNHLLGAFTLFLTGCIASCCVFIAQYTVHLIKRTCYRKTLVQL